MFPGSFHLGRPKWKEVRKPHGYATALRHDYDNSCWMLLRSHVQVEVLRAGKPRHRTVLFAEGHTAVKWGSYEVKQWAIKAHILNHHAVLQKFENGKARIFA